MGGQEAKRVMATYEDVRLPDLVRCLLQPSLSSVYTTVAIVDVFL